MNRIVARPLPGPVPRSPRGFTLIEMLVVVLILGILASLISAAVLAARGRGIEAQISSEITQLALALDGFKSKYGAYPPGLGSLRNGGANNPISETDLYTGGPPPAAGAAGDLEARLLRFVSTAFPRMNVTDFATLQDTVGRATLFAPDFSASPTAVANNPVFTAGMNNCCDLYTLDAAEALVFWLGGLPRRRAGASGQVAFELTRFAADPANPFAIAADAGAIGEYAAARQRTETLFEFDATRLTDIDNDGWPEYVTTAKPGSGVPAPYVYFEAGSYDAQPCYPDPGDGVAPAPINQVASLIDSLGVAKPYARLVNDVSVANPTDPAADRTNWTVTWQNPESFQIVSAGRDGLYGPAPAPITYIQSDSEPRLVLRMYPDDRRLPDASPGADPFEPILLSAPDRDNLTNFTSGRLADGFTNTTE